MSIYDIAVENYDGSTYLLKRYKGKVLIIVNTATNCTLNDQFNKLEMLYKKYHKYGLEILSFPCNDFNNQEPELIKDIYRVYKYKFGITFPIHAKINVNGEHEHPLYTLLKCKQPGLFGSQIKWNFTKFVVDQQGNIVKRFLPCDNPNQMGKLIRQLLK